MFSWALLLGLTETAERRVTYKKPHSSDSEDFRFKNTEEALGEGLTMLIQGYLSRPR
jgi:hypothetical protein